MKRVGIFGGSFNPPHIGHLKLVRAAAEQLALDKVLIIPALNPPHKDNSELASAQDRLNMCRLAFRNELFEISDIELRREGKSYTVDTLKEIKKERPRDKLFLIIGSDMLLSFHTWKDYREILNLATLAAAIREGESSRPLIDYKNKFLQGHNVVILEFTPIPISSTEIREGISKAEIKEFLVPEVKEYIESRMLYR